MTTGLYSKVLAAAAGAGGGSAAGIFLTWLLGGLIWGGSLGDASAVDATVAAVPAPVTGLLTIVLAVTGSGLAGYLKVENVDTSGDDITTDPLP